jgi:predicted helicase
MAEAGATKREIQKYFAEVREKYAKGDYTELSFRTPLENFITSLDKEYKLTQEPKRTRGFGAPDFKAAYGSRKVGYIETKDLGENLDNVLESDQLKKYMESTNNLILTNYNRFILIRKGSRAYDLTLFSLADLSKSSPYILDEKIENFSDMLHQFFKYELPTITSAEELAKELSRRAKLLKESAMEQLHEDLERNKNNEKISSIYEFYEGMKELINDISIEDCADAYAQTVTYGLFLARKNCQQALDRTNAASYIPKNVGIIKKIFLNISGEEFPKNISWIIDEIIDILNAAELNEILTRMNERGKKDKDPIIFFYEDFLNYYEPEKRKKRGVYYTPRPVVNYIVNSVHSILKEHFDKTYGLADPKVNVLDPAIGTGTFFWIAFLVVLNEMRNQGMKGAIPKVIENHLLKNFYGFELLMTPYVISHLKLTNLLQSWNYTLKDEDRIQVYLTNTLDPSGAENLMPFMQEIKEEIRTANEIKLKKPIIVVMGNPPYAGISANKGEWIDALLKEGYTRADGTKDDGYYIVDGKPLGEKNPKWLQDDYVKFIRYAQWKIDKNGGGAIGYITNHSYLDNPTFRGMRESLLQSFDRIYILNLHGNSLKKEKCPDGSKDENVFDIRQGVAIGIFIKNKGLGEKKVYYADLWGLREDKYFWLDRHTVDNVEWQEAKPVSPYYFFIPKDTSLEEEYEKFWKITDIFGVYGVGMTTARDNFVIDFEKENLIQRMKRFKNSNYSDENLHGVFKIKKKRGWSIQKAWNMLQKISDDELEKYTVPVLYRPFDRRWIFYHDSVVWRTVKRIMHHMLKENLGLIIPKRVESKIPWSHVLCTDRIIDHVAVSLKTVDYLFPIYLYPDSDKKPNLSPEFLKFVSEKYNRTPTPEEIFYYIYAVLHSPTYRKKYEEFLRYDFPRIPFVDDYDEFKRLSDLGKELVELHLMKKRLPTEVKFDMLGSNIVETVKYENGKVWINKEQCFDGVPEDVWNFYIGGYQVLDKWLKSRKNKELTTEEIEQFRQIVEIIKETIRIMKEIDNLKVA